MIKLERSNTYRLLRNFQALPEKSCEKSPEESGKSATLEK